MTIEWNEEQSALDSIGEGKHVFFDIPFDPIKIHNAEDINLIVAEINKKIAALCTSITEVAWLEDSNFKGQQYWVSKSKKTLQDLMSNKAIWTVTDPMKPAKKVEIFKLWWEHNDRRTVMGMTFDPKDSPYIAKGGKLNTWSGLSCAPTYGTAHEPILNFIMQNISNDRPEVYNFVVNFIAHMVQYPNVKPRTCISLCSTEEGTGKGTLVENILGNIFGRHQMTLRNTSEMMDRFNAHLQSAIVVYHDESLFAGNKALSDAMKSAITTSSMSFERKGRDKDDAVPVYHRHFISTNNVHSTMISDSDRRYFVITPVSVPGRDKDWFRSFHAEVVRNPIAISDFLGFLMAYDVDTHLVNNPIDTMEKSEQRELSLSGPERFMADLADILNGDVNMINGLDSFREKTSFYRFVSIKPLKDLYKAYQKENNIHIKETYGSKRWGMELKIWTQKLAGFPLDFKTVKGYNGYDVSMFLKKQETVDNYNDEI